MALAADQDLVLHARNISRRYGAVTALADASQSSLRDPRIHSTVCGLVTPAQLDQTVGMAETVVPDALWEELEALRPSIETWIDD